MGVSGGKTRRLSLIGLDAPDPVVAGDDLAAFVLAALERSGERLEQGDALVVAQKIVSKAEGRLVRLADVTPDDAARDLAERAHKDPRAMALLLAETREVLRVRPGVVVVEDRRGLVLANAGMDASNVAGNAPEGNETPGNALGGEEALLLLPDDPDESARTLRNALEQATGVAPAVLVIDSIGRAWRQGTIGTAIGVAGMPALLDLRGRPDMFGRPLQTSELGLADEVAAAASLVMGQGAERCPVVLVRGLDLSGALAGDGKAADLQRPRHLDMFR